MLRALGLPVAPCCDMLGVVGSYFTIFKLEPTTPNVSHIVAKRAQHVAPNSVAICCIDILRSFGRGFKSTLVCTLLVSSFLCIPINSGKGRIFYFTWSSRDLNDLFPFFVPFAYLAIENFKMPLTSSLFPQLVRPRVK